MTEIQIRNCKVIFDDTEETLFDRFTDLMVELINSKHTRPIVERDYTQSTKKE